MLAANREHYFAAGQSALHCIRVSMLAAGVETFRNILDLPCGYGRVLRHLRFAFPEARLTACDINTGGIQFCATTFGATPVQGDESARKIQLEGNYDLIWMGSLLTHLDSIHSAEFVETLSAQLSVKGLLVFTIHGRTALERMRSEASVYALDSSGVAEILRQYEDDGYGFARYPEGFATGAEENYGISLTSPCWIFRQIEKSQRLRLLNYSEGAWDNHQDVVTFRRV